MDAVRDRIVQRGRRKRMSELTLYELPPSPNNMKVRIGLGFKGLQFASSTSSPATAVGS
jgi:hypothetical protein